MIIKHKIEYVQGGDKKSILNVLHSDLDDTLDELTVDPTVIEATTQEYPLKYNKPVMIISNGERIYEENDRKHLVSFSGGKDSTAMLIRMLELDMHIDGIIFADTKYEFDEMYEYIDKVEKYIQERFDPNLKIQKVTTEDTLEEWMFGKVTRGKLKGEIRGMPLTTYPCYWSRESKIKPLNREMQGQHRYIGIALDEKNRKSKYADDMLLHYPLIEWGWTEQDCIDYLEEIDMMNPLYTDEVTRTGCWWCPKQSVGAWRSLYLNHPDKWEELKQLENRLGKPIRIDKSMNQMGEDFNNEED